VRKLLLILIISLLVLQPAAAQQLLQLDQLTSGELTAEQPIASYFVALTAGQTLQLQAVVVTSELVLQGALSTATGVLIQNLPNPNNSASLEAVIRPAQSGIFRIDISSANASLGQFVLLAQELEPIEPDEELQLDEPVSGTLQSGETIAYALSGDPATRLILDITTEDPLDSVAVQLLDEADGSIIASIETQEVGGELLIPAGRRDYQITLSSSQETPIEFELALTLLDGPISTPVINLTLSPDPTVCTVTPLNISVNVRSGPSTQFGIVTSLPPAAIMTAVARNPEGTWLQVNTGTGLGWVSTTVVVSSGPCASLPVVFIPTPTFNPATAVPTGVPTIGATAVTRQCAPFQFYHTEDNGAYMTISLPAAPVSTIIHYLDGYHTEFVFPTCRAILWSSLTFTCVQYGDLAPVWELSQFGNFDWNATCGSNTNVNQPGMSFGVR